MAAEMDKKHDPIVESLEPAVETSIEKGDVSGAGDLDLLGKLWLPRLSIQFIQSLMHQCSPIGLQAGIETSLFNDPGFCYRF